MALDPRLSLAIQPVEIPQPDMLRTLLTAAQLRQSQQQTDLANVQLAQANQQLQRQNALNAALMGQQQPGALSGLRTQAGMVPNAPPETYVRPPQSTRTPGMGDVQGYQRAPQAMQPPALGGRQQVPLPGMTPQRALELGGTEGIPVANALRQGQLADMQLHQEQMKSKLQQFQLLEDSLGAITSQQSLDLVRAHLRETEPTMARLLPQTYDEATITKMRQQMVPYKQRMQQFGLQPQWGIGPDGKTVVPMQTTNTGEIQPSKVPQGYQVLPPMQTLNQPTQQITVPRYGGPPVATYPKDVLGGKAQEAAGAAIGKTEGERGEKAKAAYANIQQVEQKHDVVLKDIDRALETINAAGFPATGFLGESSKNVPGTPGYRVARLLEGIRGNIGLDELRSLREGGGTLGQVTEAEHRLLQSVQGSLQQGDKAILVDNLTRLKQTLADNKARRLEAYQRDYGQLLPPPAQKSPYSHLPIEKLTPAQLQEEKRWLEQQLGGR